MKCEAEAEEKTSETIITKIFNELPRLDFQILRLMRKPTTKDVAEYFRLALEAGLCRENEIEDWADRMIAETNSPAPDWLLNLSIESEASRNKLLEAVPGEADQIAVWSLLLARFGIANRTNQLSREQIVKVLYRWERSGELPDQFYNQVDRLDDSLEGTKHGHGWCSEDQFITRFEHFFAPFRSFESFLLQSKLQTLP